MVDVDAVAEINKDKVQADAETKEVEADAD